MRVLLLGGTGAIGSCLSQILSNNHIHHSISSRAKRDNSEFITFVTGNAHELSFIYKICSEHWDAIIDFMSYKTEEFNSHIKILLQSTDQYVFLSSARVYGNEEHPINEKSPRLLDCSKDREYLETDEYALTKARQENILRESGFMNWTIVRPYITYGDERFQLGVLEKEEWLFRALHGRTIVFSEDIVKKITTLTCGYDVAKGIYELLGKPSALCNAFHFTNPQKLRWCEIYTIYQRLIQKMTNNPIRIKLVPTKVFLTTRDENLKYQVIYDRLYNRDFDSTASDMYIDSNEFVRVEDGLEQCLSKFLKAPKWKYINWIYEAKKDKITGEYTPMSQIHGIKNKFRYIIYRYFV